MKTLKKSKTKPENKILTYKNRKKNSIKICLRVSVE